MEKLTTKLNTKYSQYQGLISPTLVRFLIIGDQRPRRWYKNTRFKFFESDAWKMWVEDYSVAFNELTPIDFEYLEQCDHEYMHERLKL